MTTNLNPHIVKELAPNGVLRAGINLSNFLLVTGQGINGDPEGVAPDMAQEIANKLGVKLKLVPFKGPGLLADAADQDIWDIGLIGAEPARAEKIKFTNSYVEIEATYLVRNDSPFKHANDVDKLGATIAVSERTAYDLWLVRNIQNATIVHAQGFDATVDIFIKQKIDALASLRPALLKDVENIPNTRILHGRFTSIKQSVGTSKKNIHAHIFLEEFVQDSVKSGFVQKLIEKHKVNGLSVSSLS